MNIGIIGYGVVGKAVELAFVKKCNVYCNDLPSLNPVCQIYTESKFKSKKYLVENCDFIFVCVPTPFNKTTKSIDTTIIDGVIEDLDEMAVLLKKDPIVIVKSAVVPRVVNLWSSKVKKIELVISPEYLTDKNSYHDMINQKVMILGGTKTYTKEVEDLFKYYSICNRDCKVSHCSREEACFLKYMENSFLAVKNIFNNQFKALYDTYFNTTEHSLFNRLLEIFYTDERMGVNPFPYQIPGPDGDIGYGGKCLPKDVKSIISEAKFFSKRLTLMERVDEINESIRTKRDWEDINGAFL